MPQCESLSQISSDPDHDDGACDGDSLFGSPISSRTELDVDAADSAQHHGLGSKDGRLDSAAGPFNVAEAIVVNENSSRSPSGTAARSLEAATDSSDSQVASRRVPHKIQGLNVFPSFLPREREAQLLGDIARSNIFLGGQRDQAMFFSSASESQRDRVDMAAGHRGTPSAVSRPAAVASSDGVPSYLKAVPELVADLLASQKGATISEDEWQTLFWPQRSASTDSEGSAEEEPHGSGLHGLLTRQRQYILNLYKPAQGISPHVDLPDRYEDGIIGLCLGSGCVMDFARSDADGGLKAESHSIYLPPRTIYTMIGPARWEWTHGIPARDRDRVAYDSQDGSEQGWQTLLRDVRVSITLRWMREGANVVGPGKSS